MKRLFITILTLAVLVPNLPAQILGATDNGVTTRQNDFLYKPKGHYLRMEAGFLNDLVDASYGYQVNSYLLFGGGFGFGLPWYLFDKLDSKGNVYHVEEDIGKGIPVFTEVVFSTPKHKWAFYTDLKFGTVIPIYNKVEYYKNGNPKTAQRGISSIYFKSILGFRYRNIGVGAGVALMGKWQFQTQISYNIPLKVHE